MEFHIRELQEVEYPQLVQFLYGAIFVPAGHEPPDVGLIDTPELQVYIANFGKENSDYALAAEMQDQIIGIVWTRIMNDYGHVDDETPSFAISVLPEFQAKGVGSALMEAMFNKLKENNFKKASLSVQKANYAVKLYTKLGFRLFSENDDEYVMIKELSE